MKNHLSSLPLQLLAFVVLPLLALLMIVAFGGVALHQSAMRDMLAEHNRRAVAAAAASLSERLAQRQALLDNLVAELEAPEDASALLARSRWLYEFFDQGVALYSAAGERLAVLPPAPPSAPPSESVFFPLLRAGENATRIVIATPPNEDAVRAVGVISWETLSADSLLTALHQSPSTATYLLGAEGVVLFHSDPAYVGQHLDLAPSPQDTAHTEIDGGEVIVTTAPIPASGWVLVQEERWQETLSPLMRYSQAAPLALVPGLLIALGAVWFGVQRVVYPLQRLEAQATELAWGDFEAVAPAVGGIEEIRRLQATLRHMAHRVQAAQANMHNYIGAITRAQEEERRRLARELHDQTAQALVALGHRQQMLKPYLKDDPTAAALLTEIRAMIVEAINDLRRIVRALRPIYLEELGLAPALQMLARDLADERVAVHFEQHGAPKRLAPEHEMALYRIAQEALNNAWQHSNASQIWLSVRFEATHVLVSVRDNGQGFVAPRHATELGTTERKHFGIMGMYERAALIGAHLQVQSEPGNGTTITVRAPIEDA